jgi:PKD repeat protein
MKTRLLLLSVFVFLMLPSLVSAGGASRRMGAGSSRGVSEKLPMISTKWAQGCFFNAGCPTDTASHTTCLHVPAGSGATAMAQIMKYYQYPAHGTGEHGYQHPKYGIQYANFGAANYDWNTMPDSLTAGNEGVAALLYQCGVAQNMNYGSLFSSSLADDIDTALVKYFSYPETAAWKSKSDYGDSEWIAMLKTELDASHPLLFSGSDISGLMRHYFICDGYQGNDSFHFNWGWGGVHDGYYSLTSLKPDTIDFSFAQRVLFNLAPAPASYIMDFENVPDFSLTFNAWTVNDMDKHDTYGITGFSYPHQTDPMAFLSFNPAQVTPSMASDLAIQPHGGQRFGACFSSNPPSNDDWFISPQVQLGLNGSFSFWVKSYDDKYGLDTYTVAVSATDNNPGSFTTISGTQPLQTTLAWTLKTFNLSNFNNQKVYVAVHCVSNDHFLMMIDDLEVKALGSSTLKADFAADKPSLMAGESANFTDLSEGFPTSWTWTFTGGSPATSTLQNPVGVTYQIPGTYPVKLKVSNGTGSDSITRFDYISVTGYPSSMSLDFESVADFALTFSPWTVIDVKGGNTYGIQSVAFPHNYEPMAYICFVPAQTTPPLVNMQAHSGQKLGCCFSSTPPMNPNDKWLISPKMTLGINPQIEFWVKSYNTQFGNELYNVAVSTSDPAPASFVPLTASPEASPADWTRRSYDLSAYTHQNVYIGIQCVTNDGFIFMLDDISITSSVGINETGSLSRLSIFPNPAQDHLILHCPAASPVSYNIDMISILGEKISSWNEVPVAGRIMLDVHDIPQGVYLLHIVSGGAEVIRKISIIKQ